MERKEKLFFVLYKQVLSNSVYVQEKIDLLNKAVIIDGHNTE